jgi:hypothetical protein
MESDSSRVLQTLREVVGTGAGYKKAIGIVSVWKSNDARLHARITESRGESRRGSLARSIRIGIKGYEDLPAGVVRKLCQLLCGEVAPERTGRVAKAGLPQDGKIE